MVASITFDNVEWKEPLSIPRDRSKKSKQTFFVLEVEKVRNLLWEEDEKWMVVYFLEWWKVHHESYLLLHSIDTVRIEFLYNRFQVNWTLGKLIILLYGMSPFARGISRIFRIVVKFLLSLGSVIIRTDSIIRDRNILLIPLFPCVSYVRFRNIWNSRTCSLHPELISSVSTDRKILTIVG